MLLALYFLIVIALPLALGSYVVYHGLPRSRRCPACAGETLRLRSRLHRQTSRLLRATVQRRWCLGCGWCGTVRLDPPRVLPDIRPPAPAPDRVDLRTVHVDGDSWRVMVECWAENGRWVARLVFEDPIGRVCADERSFEGRSVLEVLSRAYSLPEDALAGRLRRSIH